MQAGNSGEGAGRPIKGATMAGRGPQTFKKRQKEEARKERKQEKLAKRLQKKDQPQGEPEPEMLPLDGPLPLEDFQIEG
jgi:hypothetical protein